MKEQQLEKHQSTQLTEETTSAIPKVNKRSSRIVTKIVTGVTVIIVAAAAGFGGAWLFWQTGLAKITTSNVQTEASRQLVLQEGEVVAETAKEVSPSVVSIVAQKTPNGFLTAPQAGSGTGIIISKDGYIITNKHVVPEGVDMVRVILADGTSHEEVLVVGRDPLNDLAFLKLSDGKDLKPAKLSDKKVVTGQKVIAIGNALGQYQNSVTAGIISAMGRPVTAEGDNGNAEQLLDLYQTDAAINPGNSGGPLINLEGEVIGINTAVANKAQGIGFAIPVKAAKGLVKGLLAKGKIERPYLGVHFIVITPEIAQKNSLKVTRGAYVKTRTGSTSAIVPGSPAAQAGLKDGDIITKVNGEGIDESASLGLLAAQYAPGETLKLTVLRGDAEMTLDCKLGTYSSTDS